MPINILRDQNVLLVHFASSQRMHGYVDSTKQATYGVAALKEALQTKPALCCSTVARKDSVQDFRSTGAIGLIIAPHSYSGIIHAEPDDGGTAKGDAGTRVRTDGKTMLPVTSDMLTRAIQNRGVMYNEIVVTNESHGGYTVIGAYIEILGEYRFAQDPSMAGIKLSNMLVDMRSLDLPLYAYSPSEDKLRLVKNEATTEVSFDYPYGQFNRSSPE